MQTHFSIHDSGSLVQVAQFQPRVTGARETHICIDAPATSSFKAALDSITCAYENSLANAALTTDNLVFGRLFLSDAANQKSQLRNLPALCSPNDSACVPGCVSVIEQPPIGGRKLALWAYHVDQGEPSTRTTTTHGLALQRGSLCHHWSAGLHDAQATDCLSQSRTILNDYRNDLEHWGATLKDHSIRTWFYVRDIDADYASFVTARNRVFDEAGLTPQTHFIASTGIAGRAASPSARVVLDAYSIGGLQPKQVKYLQAPGLLGPTHHYGVAFERGTRVSYGDRHHAFISGTASIDPAGNTLFPNDVIRQCERAFKNVAGLLASAGGSSHDIGQLIAYVRDASDGPLVEEFLRHACGDTPRVVVCAPVCRPAWLVEFECMAIIPNHDAALVEF